MISLNHAFLTIYTTTARQEKGVSGVSTCPSFKCL